MREWHFQLQCGPEWSNPKSVTMPRPKATFHTRLDQFESNSVYRILKMLAGISFIFSASLFLLTKLHEWWTSDEQKAENKRTEIRQAFDNLRTTSGGSTPVTIRQMALSTVFVALHDGSETLSDSADHQSFYRSFCTTQFMGLDLARLDFTLLSSSDLKSLRWRLLHGSGGQRRACTTATHSLDLRGARFTSSDLRFAQLPNAILCDARLEDTQMEHANLRGANLRGARLVNARLLNADLRDADLRGAILDGAQLGGDTDSPDKIGKYPLPVVCGGTRFDLRAAKLRRVKAPGVILQGLNLDGVDFSAADLSERRQPDFVYIPPAKLRASKLVGACFEGALLHGVDFSGCSLRSSNFRGASLCPKPPPKSATRAPTDPSLAANFSGADLTKADFREAKVAGVDFTGANTHDTDFRGVNLSDAVGLTNQQLEKALHDSSTVWPSGMSE